MPARVGLRNPAPFQRPRTDERLYPPYRKRHRPSFLDAAPFTTQVWRILADFDLDGSYEADITARFTALNGALTTRRGMGPDGRYASSSISGSLLNDDGALTPDYSSSPYYGKIRTGAGIRIQIAIPATTYILWTGSIVHWLFDYDAQRPNLSIAQFTAEDLSSLLRERVINIVPTASVLTGTAIVNILDAVGNVNDRDL